MTDHNTPKYLDKLREAVFELLRDRDAAPSAPLQGMLSPLLYNHGIELINKQYLD
jgi:histone deacetylase 1/2